MLEAKDENTKKRFEELKTKIKQKRNSEAHENDSMILATNSRNNVFTTTELEDEELLFSQEMQEFNVENAESGVFVEKSPFALQEYIDLMEEYNTDNH